MENKDGRVPDGTRLSQQAVEPASGLAPTGFDPSRCNHCGFRFGYHEASCEVIAESERELKQERAAIRQEIELALSAPTLDTLTIRRGLLEMILPYFSERGE